MKRGHVYMVDFRQFHETVPISGAGFQGFSGLARPSLHPEPAPCPNALASFCVRRRQCPLHAQQPQPCLAGSSTTCELHQHQCVHALSEVVMI